MSEEIKKQGKLFGRAVKVKDIKEKKPAKKSDIHLQSLSYSSISDYLECPKLFYFKHYLKIKLPQKQMALVFGGAVHSAFEAFSKSKDPYVEFTKEFNINKLNPDERIPEEIERHVLEGKRFIDAFVQNQDYFKSIYGLDLTGGTSERMFRTWMVDPIMKQILPVAFSGRVDFETTDGKIIDYKTSSKPFKQDEVDQDLQPSYYILEYLIRNQKLPEGFYYVVFIKGRKEPLQIIKTTRTKEQLSVAFKMAELVLKGVKGNQFERSNDWRHKRGWCDCIKYEQSLLL